MKKITIPKLHDTIAKYNCCKLTDITDLIDQGVDVNLQDPKIYNGASPLHICSYVWYFKFIKKNYKIMKLLIDNGANVNLRDNNDNTVLQIIMQNLKYDNSKHYLTYSKLE